MTCTLVTINTHRRLYSYTHLLFGVASAPALFHKTMDTIVQGIPNVICYIKDIIGDGNDTHMRNLAEDLENHE